MIRALLSGTFHTPGDTHLVETVHQREPGKLLESLGITLYASDGTRLSAFLCSPDEEIIDLEALPPYDPAERLMVTFDARYDDAIFPYRPHHYGFRHRPGSDTPPLYYALNAVLGGVPAPIGVVALNNFETYVIPPGAPGMRYSVLVGNLSRHTTANVTVTSYAERMKRAVGFTLVPGAHHEVKLDSASPERVEVKARSRVLAYIVGRNAAGELTLFDHLFSYAIA